MFPNIKPMDYESALRLALGKIDSNEVETVWSDALVSSQGDRTPVALISTQGMILERRRLMVDAPTAAVYRSFAGLGGKRGWLYMDWAWQIRGQLDRLLGGVGMRRGRRDPDDLRVGDTLDFWRVEQVEPGRLIRLRAEMKVPGRAWLQLEARPAEGGQTELLQTAIFEPKGLFGFLYWYVLYPMHALIFSGMIRKIAERSK
jgi:hypothetical protein